MMTKLVCLILLVGAVCVGNVQAQMSLPPRLVDVGLIQLNNYRPAISIDYNDGWPGLYSQGQSMDWDLRRIAGYCDAVGESIGGLDQIGAPGDTGSSTRLAQQYIDHVTSAGQYRLGSFVHVSGGAPVWFLDSVDWYGGVHGLIGSDPRAMCWIADPLYYQSVVDRYASEIINTIPVSSRPDLWWLENEPGASYVNFDRLRTYDCSSVAPLWQQFLVDECGTVSDLNQAAGTGFIGFSEVGLDNDNWLVRILVARFASWLLHTHYQGQTASAFRTYGNQVPAATRWLEMSTNALDPCDFSRFDVVNVDYPGITLYAGKPDLPYVQENRSLLGKATAHLSMLKSYGKPIACSGLGYWRGSTSGAGGGPERPFRPWEFENLMYRSLGYNVGLHNVSMYASPGADGPSWFTHAYFPDFLKSVRRVIRDWNRIQPYATFGARKANDVLIVISRNGRLYPITDNMAQNDHYYGDVLQGAAAIMEDPGLSYFDVMEEHAPLATGTTLAQYKGLIVYDCCMTNSIRQKIHSFIGFGKPVLIIGATKYINSKYLPGPLSSKFPITGVVGNKMSDADMTIVGSHQLLDGITTFPLVAPTEVALRTGATVLGTVNGKPVLVASNNLVAYLSGIPYDLALRKKLYANFLAWCGARTSDLYVSRFEKTMVLQNYKSEHIRTWTDGAILQEFPQITKVTMDVSDGQLWETKGDYPWLAYKDTTGGRVIEAIHFDTCQVRVFQKFDGNEYPHFEDVSDGLGFTQFMLGTTRLRGYFKIAQPGTYSMTLVQEMWGSRPVSWKLRQVDPQVETPLYESTGTIMFSLSSSGDTLYQIEVITD